MLWLHTLFSVVLSSQYEKGVLLLDDTNFTEELKGREGIVLFFDPRCGSGNLALHELTQAASTFQDHDVFIIGKINLLENIHVPTALKVNTTPKILFINDIEMHEFDLPIKAANILKYIEAKRNPRLVKVQEKDLKSFLKPGIISFLLFDEENSKNEWKVARSLRFFEPINIAMCSDFEAYKLINLSSPGLYAINLYHGIYDKLEDFSYENIVDFVVKRDIHKKLPIAAAYELVIEKELPAVYLFRSEAQEEVYMKVINETIAELGDMRIVFADLAGNIVFSRIIGLPASSQPCIMLIEPIGTSLKKFSPSSSEVTKTNILQLISDWKKKVAKRYYKSTAPVKGELVGLNFEKIIENTVIDSLVHFYAPWCTHCKDLEKELEKAVQALSGVKILRVNAEDNEIPGHLIEEYPTLKFYYPITKKWFVFNELQERGSPLDLWERIVEFVKNSRKDRRTGKITEDL